MPILSNVRHPLLNLFLILIGESILIGSPFFSKDLNGSKVKIRLSDKFLVTSTEKAPFLPLEGRMVPDK